MNYQLYWKDENKEKEAGNGPLERNRLWLEAEVDGAVGEDVNGDVGWREDGILDRRPFLHERCVGKPEVSVMVNSVQENSWDQYYKTIFAVIELP